MYDNSGNDAHDENEILIKKSELKPVNDPKCQHLNVKHDPTEELGNAFICQDCHIGWIQKVSSPS